MNLLEAIKARHAVRHFTDQTIEGDVKAALMEKLDACQKASGLNLQLVLDEPRAFAGPLARYGKFQNCKNYLVLAGPRGSDEAMGYYGQQIVLKAQQLGLNSCWVGLTYGKSKVPVKLEKGQNIRLVVALGYGENQGHDRKSKTLAELCQVQGPMPPWFRQGMEAAMLAPTAINQQQFRFTLRGRKVEAQALTGFFSKVDLGIAKYHFEIGAGPENFDWA